ncbi:MAG: hypothetical protein U0793_14925 [Gemmataceae bacterium]
MPKPDPQDKSRPTTAGCLLMLLSLGAIVAVALPLLRWRNPATGETLPRYAAVMLPIVGGAVFFSVGAAILKVLGLPISAKPEETTPSPNLPETPADQANQGH